MGAAAPTPRPPGKRRGLTRPEGLPRGARVPTRPRLTPREAARGNRNPRLRSGRAESRGAPGAGARSEPQRTRLPGCGAGRAGVLRARLLRSNLGCLGTVLARVLPFQVSRRRRRARGPGPLRSAARAQGSWRRPAPSGNHGGGWRRGRDERDLPEFIIDCESHHPLSGALKETMAGPGRCISKRAGPGTTPSPLTDDAPQRSRAPARGRGPPASTSQGRPAPAAALPPRCGTSQRPLIC